VHGYGVRPPSFGGLDDLTLRIQREGNLAYVRVIDLTVPSGTLEALRTAADMAAD